MGMLAMANQQDKVSRGHFGRLGALSQKLSTLFQKLSILLQGSCKPIRLRIVAPFKTLRNYLPFDGIVAQHP
jgi:hypothetical protein